MKFKATWSTGVIIVSIAITLLCLWLFLKNPVLWWVLLIILGPAPFTIRGYTLLPDAILVKRLFWSTRIPLDGLRSAAYEPNAMKWSIRCGNGGLFSVTGWFWSRRIGLYRAYVVHLKNTVVLRFENRTVVLSPDQPEQFVSEILKNNRLVGS